MKFFITVKNKYAGISLEDIKKSTCGVLQSKKYIVEVKKYGFSFRSPVGYSTKALDTEYSFVRLIRNGICEIDKYNDDFIFKWNIEVGVYLIIVLMIGVFGGLFVYTYFNLLSGIVFMFLFIFMLSIILYFSMVLILRRLSFLAHWNCLT